MRPNASCEFAIIGAGAAGLSATSELARNGHDVLCLEATARMGGRILTIRDPLAPIPIELGAEFLHGRPPEIQHWVQRWNLAVCEHSIRALRLRDGEVE